MNRAVSLDGPQAALLDWLQQHHVDHDVHKHTETFTAASTARAEGVEPSTFAKVVGVAVDGGRRAMLILDASDHLDLAKVRRALNASDVRLLTEGELAELAPDCELGAMPAIGMLFGLDMLADQAVRADAAISFNAGSHRFSVRVDRAAWERETRVQYADLAVVNAAVPAWAR
jgi:Ala-tRNA(Pro) deacylase